MGISRQAKTGTASSPTTAQFSSPSFWELYTPKLVTVLREGYAWSQLRSDTVAGLTVAIVALPLSMAIAIASGVSPERGLFTAIVGGFLISALGGSRFQIGGPAGAFIVLVAATVHHHGLEGLLLATMMSGVFMLTAGYLRLGTYIKFIPYPVTIGFTAGIAVIIFASQLRELFGLRLPSEEPGELLAKLAALTAAAPTLSLSALGVAILTIVTILTLKRLRPGWPGMLLAITAASLVTAVFDLPMDTIGTRFGGIPRSLPLPSMPAISGDLLLAVLPDAIAFALLGSIESLLSAVVADGMTGRRHRSSTGCGQYSLGAVWRHLCDRHDRAHCNKCSSRRLWPRLWDAACLVPPRIYANCRAPRELHSALCARRPAHGRCLEHDRDAVGGRPAALLAR